MISTNEVLSDHRYSLPSQQKSQSALKRTNSTAACELSLRSSQSRDSVVLPQIPYTQNIKTTTPMHSKPEPKTQACRQLFAAIGNGGNLAICEAAQLQKPQSVARESRSSKRGSSSGQGHRAALAYSEGRRKTTASHQERTSSCAMSDVSYRETPQTYFQY